MENRFKNFNHWIAELRRIAAKAKLISDDGVPMSKQETDRLFNKSSFSEMFEQDLSPQQAFEEEMEAWKEFE